MTALLLVLEKISLAANDDSQTTSGIVAGKSLHQH